MNKTCTLKTRRFFLFTVISAAFFTSTKAQSFQKGQSDLNLGIGFGTTFVNSSGVTSSLPAFSVSFDYGIANEFSLGAYLGYTGVTYQYSGTEWCNNGNNNFYGNYTDTYKWSYTIFAARCAYHFAKLIPNDKLDVYAGLMLGNNFARYTFTSTSPCHTSSTSGTYGNYGGAFLGGFVGARYRFTEHAGAFSELGYGISWLTLGFNYKF